MEKISSRDKYKIDKFFELVKKYKTDLSVYKTIEIFLKKNPYIVELKNEQRCPILLWSLTKPIRIFELLLKHGADPNEIFQKLSVLSWAIRLCNINHKKHVTIQHIFLLLKYNADPNVDYNHWWRQPLCCAAAYAGKENKEEIFKKLIDYNADCSIRYSSSSFIENLGIKTGFTCFHLIKDKNIKNKVKRYWEKHRLIA